MLKLSIKEWVTTPRPIYWHDLMRMLVVTGQNSNVVWLIAGTNDHYLGGSLKTYTQNMKQLMGKIEALGAKTMIIDSSIAPLMSGSDSLTKLSHQYADAITEF